MLTIKLKLIGMDRAVNPDFLEAISQTNEAATNMAARYEPLGRISCPEHPEAESAIEVQALFQSSVKVRKVKFCCQVLTDLVDERIAALNG